VVGVYVPRNSSIRIACNGVRLAGGFDRVVQRWARAGGESSVRNVESFVFMPGLLVYRLEGQRTIDGVYVDLVEHRYPSETR
jgi:hypothetical protein